MQTAPMTFTYDIGAPTATLTTPADSVYLSTGQITTLTGAAGDSVSAVATLNLYINRII